MDLQKRSKKKKLWKKTNLGGGGSSKKKNVKKEGKWQTTLDPFTTGLKTMHEKKGKNHYQRGA